MKAKKIIDELLYTIDFYNNQKFSHEFEQAEKFVKELTDEGI